MPLTGTTSEAGTSALDVVIQDAIRPDTLKPLCVDLDGTLVRSDLLLECLLSMLDSRATLLKLPHLLTTNRAALKRRAAACGRIDTSLLPYNEELLAYLRAQRADGRRLVLVTAADITIARAVADHLKLFDEVIASDGEHNLKGEAKARALVRRFGEAGFSYAGNDLSDLAVWKSACSAIVVNAGRSVRDALDRQDRTSIELVIDDKPPLFRSMLRAMRPHQWVKNALVFVPIVMAHAVTDAVAWLNALAMFAAFCATASGIYIVNDLADLSADRQHPRKRHRAIASGDVPLHLIAAAAILLIGLGIGLSAAIGTLSIIILYAFVSVSYSMGLKEYPLLDVFMLAGLYTIRVIGGGQAAGHSASLWLLAFSGFLFLSLALVKRTEEISAVLRQDGGRTAGRRGYFPGDVPMLQSFGCAASFASTVVLALFIGSDAALTQYPVPELLYGTVPLMLFWQCRLWLSTTRGHMHDDPIVFASRDWVSWIVAGCTFILFASAALGSHRMLLGLVGP